MLHLIGVELISYCVSKLGGFFYQV